MKRYRFLNEQLACDVYQSDTGRTSRGAALYLYGFPGSIGEGPVTRFLISEGFVVLQPHYPGTYDSAGIFSPNASIEMLKTLSEVVANESALNVKDRKPLKLPRAIRLCVGHSFGCFAAVRGARFLPDLRLLVLAGPAVSYATGSNGCGLIENGEKHVDYVRRSRPFTYRLASDDIWKDLYAGRLDQCVPFQHSNLKSVIGILGSEDKYFDHELMRQAFPKIVRSALQGNFTTKLIEVQEAGHGPAGLVPNADLSDSIRLAFQ